MEGMNMTHFDLFSLLFSWLVILIVLPYISYHEFVNKQAQKTKKHFLGVILSVLRGTHLMMIPLRMLKKVAVIGNFLMVTALVIVTVERTLLCVWTPAVTPAVWMLLIGIFTALIGFFLFFSSLLLMWVCRETPNQKKKS